MDSESEPIIGEEVSVGEEDEEEGCASTTALVSSVGLEELLEGVSWQAAVTVISGPRRDGWLVSAWELPWRWQGLDGNEAVVQDFVSFHVQLGRWRISSSGMSATDQKGPAKQVVLRVWGWEKVWPLEGICLITSKEKEKETPSLQGVVSPTASLPIYKQQW